MDTPTFEELCRKTEIKVTDKFTIPPTILLVGETPVATLGNFSATIGKAKAKKTFNVTAIVAAALKNGRVLNYTATFPDEKRTILYFDTEQSFSHCHLVLQRALKMAGLPIDTQPDNLRFYHLREIPKPSDRVTFIGECIARTSGLGLVIVDGIRDLIPDINKSDDASEIIGRFMQWTSEYNIHIHTVLHQNKGDDNSRGHLGTELDNKAETILRVERDRNDKNRSTVSASFSRSKEFEPFAFHIKEEEDGTNIPVLDNGQLVTANGIKTLPRYKALTKEEHFQALSGIYNGADDSFPLRELLEELRQSYSRVTGSKMAYSTVRNNLRPYLSRQNILYQKENRGNYYLNYGYFEQNI